MNASTSCQEYRRCPPTFEYTGPVPRCAQSSRVRTDTFRYFATSAVLASGSLDGRGPHRAVAAMRATSDRRAGFFDGIA